MLKKLSNYYGENLNNSNKNNKKDLKTNKLNQIKNTTAVALIALGIGVSDGKASSLNETLTDLSSTSNRGNKSSFVADASGLHLKSEKDGISSVIDFNPSENNIRSGLYVEKSDNSRLELELKSAINGVSDNRIKASLALLYSGAKQGTYISVEKGSDLEKLALAYNIAIENGRIKLSYAFLSRIIEASFQEVGKTFNPKMKQNSFGIDYIKTFKPGNLIRELVSSVVYYDVGDKNLGKLGDIIRDTSTEYEWTEVYGGIRGGSKLVGQAMASFELHETFRVDLTAGYEQIKFNQFGTYTSKSNTGLTTGIGATYRSDDYNKFNLKYQNTISGDEYKLKYSHGFNHQIEGFVEGTYKKGVNGMQDDARVFVGVNIPIGGDYSKRNKQAKLFSDNTGEKLYFSDLSPNSQVATDFVQVSEITSWKDKIAYIDKSILGVGDNLEKNTDGTLKSLLLDNGGFAVNSINSISDSSYLPFIKVIGGQVAIVDFKGLNEKLKQDGFLTGQSKVIDVSVNDTGGNSIYRITLVKGSVEIKSSIKRVFNISSSVAQAFVSGNLHTVIKEDLLSQKLSGDIVGKIIDGTITQVQVEKYINGELTVMDLENIIGGYTTPNLFDIPDLTNQTINTVITTGEMIVSGINSPTSVSTTVGTLVINGIDTGSTTGNVNNGDKVAVKLTTSGNYSTAINGTLTIGGVSDSFSVTTEAEPLATSWMTINDVIINDTASTFTDVMVLANISQYLQNRPANPNITLSGDTRFSIKNGNIIYNGGDIVGADQYLTLTLTETISGVQVNFGVTIRNSQ